MPLMERYRTTWEDNARQDALFSILSDPANRDRWDEAQFFASGHEETGRVLAFMDSLDLTTKKKSFLDFGCGVGRNTRALMGTFATGFGVDISEHMLERARFYCQGDERKPTYALNTNPDLARFPDNRIDFVYSHIVLQHIPTTLQRVFIGELLRLLAPEGVAAIQVPTGWIARNLASVAKRMLLPAVQSSRRAIRRLRAQPIAVTMEMHCIPESEVEAIAASHGAVVIASPYTNSTDRDHGGRIEFMSRREAVTRIKAGATDSGYLSQFFFIQKRAVQ